MGIGYDYITEYDILVDFLINGYVEKDPEFNNALTDPENFKPSDVNDAPGVEELKNKISIVLTVITNVGIIFSILMSVILGIKYMLGSIEEKADFKKDMVPYMIGAVLLFSICTIIRILQLVGNDINNL